MLPTHMLAADIGLRARVRLPAGYLMAGLALLVFLAGSALAGRPGAVWPSQPCQPGPGRAAAAGGVSPSCWKRVRLSSRDQASVIRPSRSR